MNDTISLNEARDIFKMLASNYIKLKSDGKTLEEITVILEDALSTLNLSNKRFERKPGDNIYDFRNTIKECTPYLHCFNTPRLGELYEEAMKYYEIVSCNR